ncbi:MAG: hypothetical protein WBC44_11330 [Planctomycetaceae bacterium]
MRRFPASVACAAVAALFAAVAPGQDYILRPGPRGFDPRLNRYGATEEKPAPVTEDADDRFDPSRTNVRIELLMAGDGGSAIEAQQWSRTLAGLGYSARIRRPLLDDKPEVTERTQGPLRFVTIVGSIDRRGSLVLGERAFAPNQAAELKDWLDDVKKYGAQGSPAGQPMWGLSVAQFESVYQSLSQPVDADVAGLPLAAAIATLPLPKQHPVRFNATAQEFLDSPQAMTGASRPVAGLTAGTSLAFLLSEHGLGFRPERTPEGGIVLTVAPFSETRTVDEPASPVLWPVGWSVVEPTTDRDAPVKDKDAVPPSRVQIAPTLFQLTEIGFASVPLAEALSTVETSSGVPVLLDRRGVAVAGIDLSKSRVKLPTRKTSWSLALKYATFPNRLEADLRRDEAGNPLVWVTPAHRGR